MVGRFRGLLRSNSGKDTNGKDVINIPMVIIKEMEWNINDSLKIDIIKSGIDRSLIIAKEEHECTD